MTAVQIISKSNGFGLSHDIALLTRALRACGAEVSVTAVDKRLGRRRRSLLMRNVSRAKYVWQRYRGPAQETRYDINLMLEHLWPEFATEARINIAVPNPEWFDYHDRRSLSLIDSVWCKTENTQRIFAQMERQTCLIGFASQDCYDPNVRRQPTFFHLAGKSPLKGTDRLLRIWRQQPGWPRLIVVQEHGREDSATPAHNIEYHMGYQEDFALRQLQNTSIYHLCTSESEGWGHSIAEAMSVGALVISVDGPPMNELVTPERGLLLRHGVKHRQKCAQLYPFAEDSLRETIERALLMKEPEQTALRQAARQWFLTNQEGFHGRIARALERTST
jgi:hypothetical protein